VRFSGSPRFFDNGSMWLEDVDEGAEWPENLKLFGKPSLQIDKAWDDMVGPFSFSLSENEAKRAWGERYTEYHDKLLGGYTAG
jgi:hypothetical protein